MRLILFIFLFSFFSAKSQTIISGIVKDTFQNPISLVNVRLIEKSSNKILAYNTTNIFGLFSLKCDNPEIKNFIIKFSSLGYKSLEIDFFNDKPNFIVETNVILLREVVDLKTVIIKTDFSEMKEKNDTVFFNLKKLLNGSELKLKDVIKKLPGLSINNTGKISYNGKKIDDLLIDGDEFYGTQHQLGTENINAEMISKIELLKKFQNLSVIKGFNDKPRTALNIYIKDKYKNAIKGNLESEYGFNKSYRQNNSVYNFDSKLKLNLLSDINNTNNKSLTVNDYLDLKKGLKDEIDEESNSNSISIDENVPSFLFSEDNVKQRKLNFYSLNFSNKISKKVKVSGFTIFNFIKQEEFSNSKQMFFSKLDLVSNKNSILNGKSLFSTSKILIESKLNENKYLNYSLVINKDQNTQENLIDNITPQDQNLFHEQKKDGNLNIGNFFTHKIKLSDKTLFEYNIFDDYTNLTKTLYLSSNQSFLNLNFPEGFNAYQKTNQSENKFGVNLKIKIKEKYGNFQISSGSSLNQNSIKLISNEANPNLTSSLDLLNTSNYISWGFNKKKIKKINYSLGFQLLSSTFKTYLENRGKLSLLPYLNFSYEISKKANLSINYKKEITSNTIEKLINSSIIIDYRTLFKKGNVLFDDLFPTNVFSLNSSFNDYSKNISSVFGVVYNLKPKSVGEDIINTINNTEKKYVYIKTDNSSYLYFNIEKKLGKLPYSFKLNTLQSFSRKESFINNERNLFNFIQSKAEIEVLSYFKSNNFNIDFGTEYLINNSKNKSTKNVNNFNKTTFYFNINGLIFKDKLNWEIQTKNIFFSSNDSQKRNVFEINPSVRYKLKNWEFFVRGTNILNIRNNNTRLKVDNQISFFEETKFSSLSGFLNTGFSFSF